MDNIKFKLRCQKCEYSGLMKKNISNCFICKNSINSKCYICKGIGTFNPGFIECDNCFGYGELLFNENYKRVFY